MSLRDAVTEIAGRMESVTPADSTLSTYAMMLRLALRASEGERQSILSPAVASLAPQVPAEVQTRLLIEKAKEEFRGKKSEAEERLSGVQTELVGGPGYDPSAPLYFERPSAMPEGAKTLAHDGVYQLRKDGKLHFCAEDTAHAKKVAPA